MSVERHVLKSAAPTGSRFKGYEDFLGLVPRAQVIRYRREPWGTPDRQTIVAALPPCVSGALSLDEGAGEIPTALAEGGTIVTGG